MKVWITKYALTDGIYVTDVSLSYGMPNVVWAKALKTHIHKPDWHESEAEAIAHSEEMRQKRIESLQNQIERLKSLDIKIVSLGENNHVRD